MRMILSEFLLTSIGVWAERYPQVGWPGRLEELALPKLVLEKLEGSCLRLRLRELVKSWADGVRLIFLARLRGAFPVQVHRFLWRVEHLHVLLVALMTLKFDLHPRHYVILILTGAYFLAYSSSMLIFKMDRRLVSSMTGICCDWLYCKELFIGERDRLDTLVCNTGLREVVPAWKVVRSEIYHDWCRDEFTRSLMKRHSWSYWLSPKPQAIWLSVWPAKR